MKIMTTDEQKEWNLLNTSLQRTSLGNESGQRIVVGVMGSGTTSEDHLTRPLGRWLAEVRSFSTDSRQQYIIKAIMIIKFNL